MTIAAAPQPKTLPSVPREYLDPPEGLINPTLLMMVAATAIIAPVGGGLLAVALAGLDLFGANVLALHLSGTVIHDASHNAAHSNRIINAVLGHSSALMLGFAFPVFTRVHLQHHGNVNDPENDPDHFVSTGGPLWMIAARFFYHEIFFFKRRLWRKYELLEWFLSRMVVVAIVVAAVHFDFLGYVMNFWFSPALVVGITLGLFFDYLPHRPFQERNRWRNARVYPSRILNILILGQNYHLIHHLWPSIPWYRYQATYWAVQPLLDAKGSPQRLGILEGPREFWNFIYDVFLGIRLHHGAGDRAAKDTPQKPDGPTAN